jgi:dipeptidyl aminopeptidase/acylaminoacyl peptidase
MNQSDRLERDLTVWFAETAAPRTPPYVDDILRQTARIRQRPRWTSLERLLSMTTTASFRATTGSLPWRALGLLALLLLAMLVGVLFIGAGQHRLPAPFGLADTGLVAYSSEGDIFVVDPATNQRHTIVADPGLDLNPQWSRDGTKIVFSRVDGTSATLFTVRADGTGLRQITPPGILIRTDPTSPDYAFSPDGRSVLYLTGSTVQIAHTDGSAVDSIEAPGLGLFEAAWRPPDGSQIAALGSGGGVYVIDVASRAVQTVVAPDLRADAGGVVWSPDGSQLAYNRWHQAPVFTVRGRIVDLATGQERLADPNADDHFWDALPTWSNDGRRLVLLRGYADGYSTVTAVIVPADGSPSTPDVEVPIPAIQECCATIEWAPDDSSILLTPVDASTRPQLQRLLDPHTGAITAAPWNTASDPAWQRVAR